MNYQTADKFCENVLINLYSLGKRNDNKIYLSNFNPKDKKHLFIYHISNDVINQIYGYEIVLEIPLLKKILYKQFRKVKSKRKLKNAINIEELLKFSMQGLEEVSIEEIYDEYYRKKD